MKSTKFVVHLSFIIFLISCGSDQRVHDLEGHNYKTIKIGNTVWFAENLQTAFFQNGDSIPNILEDSLWFSLSTPGFCYYDNNPNNKKEDRQKWRSKPFPKASMWCLYRPVLSLSFAQSFSLSLSLLLLKYQESLEKYGSARVNYGYQDRFYHFPNLRYSVWSHRFFLQVPPMIEAGQKVLKIENSLEFRHQKR